MLPTAPSPPLPLWWLLTRETGAPTGVAPCTGRGARSLGPGGQARGSCGCSSVRWFRAPPRHWCAVPSSSPSAPGFGHRENAASMPALPAASLAAAPARHAAPLSRAGAGPPHVSPTRTCPQLASPSRRSTHGASERLALLEKSCREQARALCARPPVSRDARRGCGGCSHADCARGS